MPTILKPGHESTGKSDVSFSSTLWSRKQSMVQLSDRLEIIRWREFPDKPLLMYINPLYLPRETTPCFEAL
jgi:hypothetical protein